MKIFFKSVLLFSCWVFCGNVGFAKEVLRAEEAIMVQNGRVEETGILSDSNGSVFLEFLKDTHVSNAKDKQPFVGEILPPQIIEIPHKKPRGRMTELLTFELLTDTSDAVVFVDKFSLIRPKQRIRLEYENPDGFFRVGGVELYTKILAEDKIGMPALWQFIDAEEGWQRIGGKVENSAEDGVSVFSASLTTTGVFTLLDENPAPTYYEYTQPDLVEKVEDSPFPTVFPKEKTEEAIEDDETTYLDSPSEIDQTESLIEEDISMEKVPSVAPALATTLKPEPSEEPPMTLVEDFQQMRKSMPTYHKPMPTTQKLNQDRELPERLPEAGSEENKQNFPFAIVLAIFILGVSVYFGLSKKY